jgi:hypothetical protein
MKFEDIHAFEATFDSALGNPNPYHVARALKRLARKIECIVEQREDSSDAELRRIASFAYSHLAKLSGRVSENWGTLLTELN